MMMIFEQVLFMLELVMLGSGVIDADVHKMHILFLIMYVVCN